MTSNVDHVLFIMVSFLFFDSVLTHCLTVLAAFCSF